MVWPNGFGMDFNGLIVGIFFGYCDLGPIQYQKSSSMLLFLLSFGFFFFKKKFLASFVFIPCNFLLICFGLFPCNCFLIVPVLCNFLVLFLFACNPFLQVITDPLLQLILFCTNIPFIYRNCGWSFCGNGVWSREGSWHHRQGEKEEGDKRDGKKIKMSSE
jgi:hypothetical protein